MLFKDSRGVGEYYGSRGVSDSSSIFEVMSRQPGVDDFERMSYMSKGSIRSKASQLP